MCFGCGQKMHIRKRCPLNITQDTEVNNFIGGLVTHIVIMQEEVEVEEEESKVCEEVKGFTKVSRRRKHRTKNAQKYSSKETNIEYKTYRITKESAFRISRARIEHENMAKMYRGFIQFGTH